MSNPTERRSQSNDDRRQKTRRIDDIRRISAAHHAREMAQLRAIGVELQEITDRIKRALEKGGRGA